MHAALWDEVIRRGLAEDIGPQDATTEALIESDRQGRFALVTRQPVVVCGLPALEVAFRALDAAVVVELRAQEGERIAAGQPLAVVQGSAQALLSAERTALNLLQHLCGIATATRALVDAVAPWDVLVLDTRKTLPGLRAVEKYAVRMGGGNNHRFGLFDALLIKDNHIAAVGNIEEAVRRAQRFAGPMRFVEVECDTLAQVEEAVAAGPDAILLDNMGPAMLRQAVEYIGHRCFVEASGNIRLETAPEIAATGVDALSAGYLTHSVQAADIGADWEVL